MFFIFFAGKFFKNDQAIMDRMKMATKLRFRFMKYCVQNIENSNIEKTRENCVDFFMGDNFHGKLRSKSLFNEFEMFGM